MKVLLINPPRFKGMAVGREDRCENTIPNVLPPMGLVYLAGVLEEKGHVVSLIDANAYNISMDELEYKVDEISPEVVIFRNTPETFSTDIQVAHIAKQLDNSIITIMICMILNKLPQQVLERASEVDYYITDYYYERVIPQILDNVPSDQIKGLAYRFAGEIKVNPPSSVLFDFNSIPMPAWHLIPDMGLYWVQVKSFSPYAMIESTKGCGMGCSFCTIASMKPAFRYAEKVCNEIEYLYREKNVRYIGFFDATFNLKRERVFDLCEGIIKRRLDDLVWFANVRGDRMDEEQALIMYRAGCRGVSIGIESGSQIVLDKAGKKLKVEEAKKTIQILRKTGIKQYASFIVGLEGETRDTVEMTKQFILENKPTGFQVNSFVPYPGCRLYDETNSKGLIHDMDFDSLLLYETPLSICDLNIEEINDLRQKIYHDVYRNLGWWLTNVLYVLKNPEDIKAGIHYGSRIVRRMLKGVKSEI